MSQPHQTVKREHLKPEMLVFGISELDFTYATLDPETIRFLRRVFPGAVAVLDKDGHEILETLENLKPFDHLKGLTEIPPNLGASRVTPQTLLFYKAHGFLSFRVGIPGRPLPPALPLPKEDIPAAPAQPPKPQMLPGQRVSAAKVQEARKVIEKVDTANTHRQKSTMMVEEMFDMGRSGKYSAQSVESAIEDIMSQQSSPAMKAIAGLKGSDQTYAHCVDMSVIMQECYMDIQRAAGKPINDETKRFVLVAGFMHDIGKSEVPKEVLESTVRFAPDSREMMQLRNHTVYGARILAEMGMNKTVVNVAHYHHVKMDATMFTSYPATPYDQVLPLTRLASIVDVYQALIGRRKYKKNWVPGKAVEYLLKLKGSEFDPKMLDNFLRVIGLYPVGSLVKLSDGAMAFVITQAPLDSPKHPVVGVVENAKGELVTNHDIIDLAQVQDVSIVEVVDHFEYYNKSEDQAFNLFKSIKLP